MFYIHKTNPPETFEGFRESVKIQVHFSFILDLPKVQGFLWTVIAVTP